MAVTITNKETKKVYRSTEETAPVSSVRITPIQPTQPVKAAAPQTTKDKYMEYSAKVKPTLLDRVKSTVAGGAKGALASNIDTTRTLYEAGQKGRTARDQETQDFFKTQLAEQERIYADYVKNYGIDNPITVAMKNEMDMNRERIGALEKVKTEKVQEKATEETAKLADKVQISADNDITKAKEGLGKVGQIVVDAGASTVQMAGDMAANAALGAGGMLPFAFRAFGGGTQAARQGGGTLGQQIAYGGASAAKEVFTEKMFSIALPFKKAYGGGSLDKKVDAVVQKATEKLATKLKLGGAGEKAISAILQHMAGAAGEGLEEFVGDWLEWQLPRIYGGDVDSASETLANSLYDFAVGTAAGALGDVAFTPAARISEAVAQKAGTAAPAARGVENTTTAVEFDTRGENAKMDAYAAEYGAFADNFKAYKPEGMDADTYKSVWDAIYTAGKTGTDEALDVVKKKYGGDLLDDTVVEAAYYLGKETARDNTVMNTTEEVMDDGRGVYLRDGVQRTDGENTEIKVPGVEETARGAEIKGNDGRPADRGAATLTYGESVNIPGLTGNARVLTGGETEATKASKKLAKERGLNLVLFGGDNLHISAGNESIDARGMILGNTVYVRADHAKYDAEQIMRHEAGHDMIKNGEISLDTVREEMAKRFTSEELDEAARKYAEAYDGCGMTAEEIFEEIVCDSLGGMNLFEGEYKTGEKIGGMLNTMSEIARANEQQTRGPPTENAATENGSGEAKFSRDYVRPDGIEVFTTSKETLNLTWAERQKQFLSLMENEYRGRTAKFIRNGHAYYARFDKADVRKNIYGDNKSDKNGYRAKINEGADGGIFDLVENSTYTGSKAEIGKHIRAHGGVNTWDYFVKTVQINSRVFDLLANVRKKSTGEYVYSLQLVENKKIKAASPTTTHENAAVLKSGETASMDSISSSGENVNGKFSREVDSKGNKLTEQQAEYFKDSKVRDKDGNLLVMYRGDKNNDFTVFDRKKSSYANLFGRGFYFTAEKSRAETYGEAKPYYLNITDPLSPGQEKITKAQFTRFVEAVAEDEDYGIDNYGYGATVESVVNSVFGKGDYEAISDINAACIGDLVAAAELFNQINGTEYDGIVLPGETVAFRSNQIKNVDNAAPTKNDDIRFSREVDRETAEKNVKAAEEYFGTTYKVSEAGYLLTDGKMLDFSDKKNGAPGNSRTLDHREISNAFDDDFGGDSASGGMIEFMREGNIRLLPEMGGINLSVKPNDNQLRVLDRYISHFRGEVVVDFDDENGNTILSHDYDHGTYSKNILWDIEDYFDKGKRPGGNTVRFSREVESALNKENDVLRSWVGAWKNADIKSRSTLDDAEVRKIARSIVRGYQSTIDAAEVESDLHGLVNDLAQGKNTTTDFSDIKDKALDIAEKVVGKASTLVNGETTAADKEMRKFIRKTRLGITEDMKSSIPDWNDWRRRHMGTLTLANSGTGVDVFYDELNEKYGEAYFPSDIINPTDQLLQIAQVMEDTADTYENPYGYNTAEAVEWCANEIVARIVGQDAAKTEAMIKSDRDKAAKAIKREETWRESRKARDLRVRIEKHAKALSRKLLHPTDKQHIPEQLKGAVAKVLASINTESAFDVEDVDGRKLRVEKGQGTPTGRTLAFMELKKAYAQLGDTGGIVIDPNLMGEADMPGLFDEIAEMGDTPMATMNRTQLLKIWNALRAVEHSITTANKTLSQAKYKEISGWADDFRLENKERRSRKVLLKTHESSFVLEMEDPYTYFDGFGMSGKAIYRMLRNAQDRSRQLLDEIGEKAGEVIKGVDVRAWQRERHNFTTEGGQAVTLTTAQLMGLYNLMGREQAQEHLITGGIKQPAIAKYKDAKAIEEGKEKIAITAEDLKSFANALTEKQVEVAEGLKALMRPLAAYGNEASMKVYGYTKFSDPNYWPIHVDNTTTQSTVEKSTGNVRSIKNIGLAKSVVPHANNAVQVTDAFSEFAQHTTDMVDYAVWLAPMEDANRLFNYQYRNENGFVFKSFQDELNRIAGVGGKKYWRDLMNHIQNGIGGDTGAFSSLVKRTVGNVKGASVGANIRVIVQQPTAINRAAVVLKRSHLRKAITGGLVQGKGFEKAKKYAPVARIKEVGGFDQSTMRSFSTEIYGPETALEKLNDFTSRGAAMADNVTWGVLWNACEYECHAKYPSLKVGSEEFMKRTADIFTDVVDQTQVVDGILQRSAIMRSSDMLHKQATAFMGEPIKSLNVLIRSWDNFRYAPEGEKRKIAKKQLGKAATALVITDVVNAAVQALIDAMRDDDEDKEYWERWLTAFSGFDGDEETFKDYLSSALLESNVFDNMSLVGRIPYAKELKSLLQGYSVDRMDASAYGDLIDASTALVKSLSGDYSKTTAYTLKQTLTAASKIFGISVANITRDMWGALRTIAIARDDYWLEYKMEQAIYRLDGTHNTGRYYDILYRTYKAGDMATHDKIYADMIANGFTAEKIKSGMESRMKKDMGVSSVKELPERYKG